MLRGSFFVTQIFEADFLILYAGNLKFSMSLYWHLYASNLIEQINIYASIPVLISSKTTFHSKDNFVQCVNTANLLGCKVGTCCAILSSLSICSKVVLPALSKPRKTNFPDFLYRPVGFKNNTMQISLSKIGNVICSWSQIYRQSPFKRLIVHG